MLAHAAILAVHEPHEGNIEYGEEREGDRVRAEEFYRLVRDEEREDRKRRGICPELLAQQADDEYAFDDAVAQKVERAEVLRFRRKFVRESVDMRRQKIVWVVDELVLGERAENIADVDEKERRSEHYLEQCVEPFENYAYLEELMEA